MSRRKVLFKRVCKQAKSVGKDTLICVPKNSKKGWMMKIAGSIK